MTTRKTTPKKVGRPSKYTKALARKICDRIANGESLVMICESKAMPSRTTVMTWLRENVDDYFRTEYARARQNQGDYMDHLILKTAYECTAETAQADRIKIGAYQWRASKLEPKKYGDKIDVTSGDAPIEGFTGFIIRDLTADNGDT